MLSMASQPLQSTVQGSATHKLKCQLQFWWAPAPSLPYPIAIEFKFPTFMNLHQITIKEIQVMIPVFIGKFFQVSQISRSCTWLYDPSINLVLYSKDALCMVLKFLLCMVKKCHWSIFKCVLEMVILRILFEVLENVLARHFTTICETNVLEMIQLPWGFW